MEKFYWADKTAEGIIKKNKKKKIYVCASGITPSGTIHIGNFREVITTELVVRALQNKGKKVKFLYSWDDYDRFRKVPKNAPKEYEKYVGMPVSDVPSQFDKKLSYARYFEKQFEDSLKPLGIKPDFIQQHKMNKKCAYAKEIKKALDKRGEIMEILNKFRKDPLAMDWYPINIYCEKCNKDFTKVLGFKGYKVDYSCECGYNGKIDFRKTPGVKLVWRVDWPSRWAYEHVDFEPGGIDHSVHGGSFTTGKEIVKEVYDSEAPMYTLYEWIKIKGGTVFASSSGNATSLGDVLEVYEPEIVRYLFAGTRPNRAFQISFDNDVIKIYEDYDSLERKYYSEKANTQERRMYELCQPIKPAKKKPDRLGFRNLIMYVQLNKTKELSKESRERAKYVKNWLDKHAEEDMRFTIQTTPKAKLVDIEKKAVKELIKLLESKKILTEDELFKGFYDICQKLEIKNSEFFDAAYRIIINKSKGPRLASLILIAGKDNIIKLLKQVK